MPADAPAEYAPAMVNACSQALPTGSCALASATPESTQPEAVALVLWQGSDWLTVTVRVGRHGSHWVARSLTFSTADSLGDRFTAVGLTVATLVGEGKAAESASEVTPEKHEGPPAPPVSPAPAPAVAPAVKRRFEFQGALGGFLGNGWQGGGWQRGVWGVLGTALRQSPFIVQGFASYGVSGGPELAGLGSVHSQWLSAGLGLGVQAPMYSLNVRVGALVELLVRHVNVELQEVHGSANEVPVRLRGFASWPARGPLAASLGSALRVPLIAPREGDLAHLRQPLFSLELFAGLEARL